MVKNEKLRLSPTSYAQIQLLEEIIYALFDRVEPPRYVHFSPDVAGFRFTAPSAYLFCLLKLGKAVSTLNAMRCLLSGGFNQEICVLVRTLVECTTHAEYVALSITDGKAPSNIEAYVAAYFADSDRSTIGNSVSGLVRQEKVHKSVGAHTDAIKSDPSWREDMPHDLADRPDLIESTAASLMSEVYVRFSAYVHARYPEVMDLIGGEGPRIHLNGTKGTPKDKESREIIETFIVTASNALKFAIFKFNVQGQLTSLRHRLWLHSKIDPVGNL